MNFKEWVYSLFRKKAKPYGKSLHIDMHFADVTKFNRKDLKRFFHELCVEIDMSPEKITWWDDHGVPKEYKQTMPHTTGTTAVQFILTSDIVIHTLDIMERVYLDIFTCKELDQKKAENFVRKFFSGRIVNSFIRDRI